MAERRIELGVSFARGGWHSVGLIVALLIGFGGRALALDPSKAANSYMRTVFTTEDGLPLNTVDAVLQTRNGFLWISTVTALHASTGDISRFWNSRRKP